MKNKKAIKKVIVCIVCIAIVVGIVGTGIGLQVKEMNTYEKIASPVGFSEFTAKDEVLVNDADFYVSVNGNDNNDGSFNAPFRTIGKAKEAVRAEITALQKQDDKAFTVAIMAGEYNEYGIEFTKEDSGTESCPVTYMAYGDGKVTVNGGKSLKSEDFEPLSGDAAERINKDIASNIKTLDLSKYDLTVEDYGQIKACGKYATDEFYDNAPKYNSCELFLNSKRMTLAKYPNDTYLNEGKILDEGDKFKDDTWFERKNQKGGTFVLDDDTYNRVKSWKTTDDVWVYGYFYWDWADMSTPIKEINDSNKSLTTSYCSRYGFKENGNYYFYNILEELDAPNEYYIDRDTNILYFYPSEDLSTSQITLSITTTPIFIFNEDAKYINLNGLTIQGTRSDAVSMNGNNCEISNCLIQNAADAGISVLGSNNIISGNEICHTGKDAIVLNIDFDDYRQSEVVYGNSVMDSIKNYGHGYNIVDNNSLHDIGEIQKTYIAGVNMEGTGNKVSHNEIYNAPHTGILYYGNDHVIEYNHIHDVVLQSSDAGAIYTGLSYCTYGNVIRYNCINDIGSDSFTPSAIYFDDGSSGQTAYGNVLVNIPSYAFLIGGGRDNTVTDNLIINAQKGIDYDDRLYDGYHNNGWFAKNVTDPQGRTWEIMKFGKKFNNAIGNKYEGVNKMNQDYAHVDAPNFVVNPAGSNVNGNVIIKKDGKIGDIAESVYEYSNVKYNFTYKLEDVDEFFTDLDNGNYSFVDNCKLVTDNEKLKDIDFSKIGRY